MNGVREAGATRPAQDREFRRAGDGSTSRARVQGQKEALVASALSVAEKKQLNALLRRLMIEFERTEGGPPPDYS